MWVFAIGFFFCSEKKKNSLRGEACFFATLQTLLARAGYPRAAVRASPELAVRHGQAPEEWAAAGWAACLGMPFGDVRAALLPGELDVMRADYVRAATELATALATPEGDVAEPYEMMWVCAWTGE